MFKYGRKKEIPCPCCSGFMLRGSTVCLSCYRKGKIKELRSIKLICKFCGGLFIIPIWRIKRKGKDKPKFCSASCRAKNSYDKNKFTMKNRIAWNKGKPLGYIPKMAFKKGQNPWNKNTSKYTPEMKRLIKNTSSAISRTLKGKQKNGHWEKLVGYTADQLKSHLERNFEDGMDWNNYGSEWWIDHKIPVIAFNFKSSDHIDFKRCWALSNLQPMWKIENMKKNARLEKHFQPCLSLNVNL